MSDSEIIWKFLDREYQDDSLVVYLYCCGNVRSPKTAVSKVYENTSKIFYPAMDEHLIKAVITGFLENKKKLHLKGLIKIKPIYEGL